MKRDLAILEGVYDLVSPNTPISHHRWGRLVWLYNIEIGLYGQLLFVEDGQFKSTNLSRINNVIRTKDSLEIQTQNSIYKLKYIKGQESE